ncbi:MAG: hypothetical protein K9M96_15955 [Deltaproteobacteria bacterium]|nr:hypothetical protein [Deltaproteobacteria bacterium]
MAKVGIPIFQSRVSPVFDTCTRLLVITFEQNREIERAEIYLDNFPLTERVNILRQLDVTVLICGGISDILYTMLSNLRIRLITGIAGRADQVFDAFLSNHLHEPRFFMPGYKAEA